MRLFLFYLLCPWTALAVLQPRATPFFRDGLAWVSLHTPVYAAALEVARTPAGPWQQVATDWSPRPQAHAFVVGHEAPEQYYRVRLLDNGLVPTPYGVQAWLTPKRTVRVSCALLFRPDDSQMGPFRVYRCGADGVAVYVGTTANASVQWEDRPPAGTWSYRMQTVDGAQLSWLSDPSNYVTL
jgi:hypothetical protein